MRKAAGCFIILAIAAAMLSCEAGLSENKETADISISRGALTTQGYRGQRQERRFEGFSEQERGQRHEGRFRNFSEEELKQFQEMRKNGGRMKPGFDGEHPFIERLRLENPGMNDEELKALMRERHEARRAARQEGRGERREGRRDGERRERRGEWDGKKPHDRGPRGAKG